MICDYDDPLFFPPNRCHRAFRNHGNAQLLQLIWKSEKQIGNLLGFPESQTKIDLSAFVKSIKKNHC
jgi:hypothetical protein